MHNWIPNLTECNEQGKFQGMHVFMPPNSQVYVNNQSCNIGSPKQKKSPKTRLKSVCNCITNSASSILSIHPAIAKAWVTFSGVSGEVYEGFNILSVHKRSTGSYSIAFILPMANTKYVPITIAEGFNVQASPTLLKKNTLEVETKSIDQANELFAHDSNIVHVVVFGSLHTSYL